MHKCTAGCGKTITWRFAICSNCEKIYGSSSTMWPSWLKFLWNQEQRDRRSAKRYARFEVPLVDDLDDIGNGE